MALANNFPLNTLAGLYNLQANGQVISGNASPNGIVNCLDVSSGHLVATVRDTDPITATGLRSEIALAPEALGEYWYAFEFKLPSNWDSSVAFSLAQIHDSPDVGDSANKFPNFLFVIERGRFVATVPSATLPAEAGTLARIGSVPAGLSVWNKFVLHANWQKDATGFRECFLNGVPLMRQFGVPTAYDDVVGPYFKMGVYDCYHAAGGFGSRTAEFRNLQRFVGTDRYLNTLGGPPVPGRQLLM